MTSGGQCAMTAGAVLMLLSSASSWDMHTLEVNTYFWMKMQAQLTAKFPHTCAAGIAYSNAHFGTGTGPISLDDVRCTSSASQLLECPSRPILSHNCQHSDDAGVGCEGWLKCSLG